MDTSFTPGLYYRHSGKFSIVGVLVAIGFGLLIGLPCAWLYSYLIRWNPIVYISALASLGFGGVIGYVVDSRLKSHKCRNVLITGLASFIPALVAYYVSWAVWLNIVTHVPTVALLQNPIEMGKIIGEVNEVGTWSLRGDVMKGIPLWVIWACEAGCVIGFAVYLAVHSIRESTYCENCDRFAKQTKGVCFAGAGTAPAMTDKAAFKAYRAGLKTHAAELKQHLEVKDFAYVEKLGAPDAMAWYSFDLANCPQCNMTNTLSVSQHQLTIEGKGKRAKQKTTESKVLHQLLLTSTEAESIRKLKDKLNPSANQSVAEGAAHA